MDHRGDSQKQLSTSHGLAGRGKRQGHLGVWGNEYPQLASLGKWLTEPLKSLLDKDDQRGNNIY